VLENVLPPDTYRQVYRRFDQRVNLPANANLLRSLQADLVFCPFTGISYYSSEIPNVVVVHDLQYLYYPEFFSAEQRFHSDRQFRQVCKTAAQLICVSNFTRETVLKFGQVAAERVRTVHTSLYNPISLQSDERISQVLAGLNLARGRYLFYPANFWPHKNHAMLLTAFNLYHRQQPQGGLKLVFTGAPGEGMQSLGTAAQRMGLAEWVVFAGYLKENEFAALLQGCLALIFPSLFEGFGVPVLEAMQFGKPVLCSRITSLPEVCGEAALYFDPRRPDEILHAIARIDTDPHLLQSLVQRGQDQAARFADPDRWARLYFDILVEAFRGERVYPDSLNGLYPDRWAGTSLEILAAAGAGRQLGIEFAVPPWLPGSLTVHFSGPLLPAPQTHTLRRGEQRTLLLPLSAQGGALEIQFSPAVAPASLQLNADQRLLSCTVQSCRLISTTGSVDLLAGSST
jgi:glycosyltransferase involved in cell wall biosynthesis